MLFNAENQQYVSVAIGGVNDDGDGSIDVTTADGIRLNRNYTIRYELLDEVNQVVHAESIVINGTDLIMNLPAFSSLMKDLFGPTIQSRQNPEVTCRKHDTLEDSHWWTDKRTARWIIEVWFERKRNKRPLTPDLKRLGLPYPKWLAKMIDRAVMGKGANLDLLRGTFGFYLSMCKNDEEIKDWNTLVIQEHPVPKEFFENWKSQPVTERLAITSKEEFLKIVRGSADEIRPFHGIRTVKLWEGPTSSDVNCLQ